MSAWATPPRSLPSWTGTSGVGCGASGGNVRDRAAICSRRGIGRGFGGVGWSASTQQDGVIYSLACREVKVVGKPYEGKPHVRFEVAGGGNPDFGPRRHSLTLPIPAATHGLITAVRPQ